MVSCKNLGARCVRRRTRPRPSCFLLVVFGLWIGLELILQPVVALRPLREQARTWGDDWLFLKKDDTVLGPFSEWNITGTYRGSWKFLDFANSTSRFPDFRKTNGDSEIQLVSTPTKVKGVHYIQGVIVFHDVFDNERNVGGAKIRLEGVYIWPFRQLRMVANSGKEGDLSQEEDYILSNPYHLTRHKHESFEKDMPGWTVWSVRLYES